MIRLSCEIPESALYLTQHTDFDFVLAHKVLESEKYAAYFRHRPGLRELILDNSMHELGVALPISDLLKAACLCGANYIISPDRMDDAWWTESQYRELEEEVRRRRYNFKIAGVISGKTAEERTLLMQSYEDAAMLCLPYKRPRLDWFWDEFPARLKRDYLRTWKRIHLLGMSSIDEIQNWVQISKDYPEGTFSVDTSKPVRWGIMGREIDDGASLRGGELNAKDLLDYSDMTADMRKTVVYNISRLKEILK